MAAGMIDQVVKKPESWAGGRFVDTCVVCACCIQCVHVCSSDILCMRPPVYTCEFLVNTCVRYSHGDSAETLGTTLTWPKTAGRQWQSDMKDEAEMGVGLGGRVKLLLHRLLFRRKIYLYCTQAPWTYCMARSSKKKKVEPTLSTCVTTCKKKHDNCL